MFVCWAALRWFRENSQTVDSEDKVKGGPTMEGFPNRQAVCLTLYRPAAVLLDFYGYSCPDICQGKH